MSSIFDTFTDSAFRVECLPHYLNPDQTESDGYVAWSEGQPMPKNFNSDWVEIVVSAADRRAIVRRLRLVSDPLSSYERYELEVGYRAGIAAGEEIRVALRSDMPTMADTWFFDDKTVLHQRYAKDGTFLRADESALTKEDEANYKEALALFNRSPLVEEYLRR